MAQRVNSRRLTDMFSRSTFYLIAAILSILDWVFWLCSPFRAVPETAVPESSFWTDEDILRAIKVHIDPRLIQISKDTAAKRFRLWKEAVSEALAMDLVRRQTKIPVPYMRRMINISHHRSIIDDDESHLVVMDFVPNSQRLDTLWPSLSLWRKLIVILTMRSYLRQLRHVRYPESDYRPGPPGTKPLACDGYQFPNHGKAPVYSTLEEFEYYFRNEYKHRNFRLPASGPLPPYAFRSLVFTHNDLNMRNLLLDDRNVLWVIDWGFSGFYPPWFEYVGMRYAAQKDKCPETWLDAIKYMAEPDFEIEEWLDQVGYGFKPYVPVKNKPQQ